MTHSRRNFIAKAACRQVAYDLGYKAPLAATRLPYWYGSLNVAIADGENQDPVSPSRSGSRKYTDDLDRLHPGYLRELYRYAESVLGSLSTWDELAESMNLKSATPGEERPTISISRKQLSDWFIASGGKEMSPVEKPLLTTQHRAQRLDWARQWFDLLVDSTQPVAFLDEKWFYTTNRRRRMKVLPTTDDDRGRIPPAKRPRIRSRRYPVKVMYMGVVACPQLEKGFDGRVLLERVSRQKQLSRSSRNTRFSVDVHCNEEIKTGKWKRFIEPGQTVEMVLDTVQTIYDLDEFVCDRLVLGFDTYSATNGKKRWKELSATAVLEHIGMRTNEEGNQVAVTIDDLMLMVQLRPGDIVDEDCSCDSSFMLEKVPTIGAALRAAFHWVPRHEKIYLCMDNAGGHGTKEAIDEYTGILWNDFGVEIIWQVPRSPETNMLDLGVWMSIQTAVTRVHHGRRCQHYALAKSVEEAWSDYLSPASFQNVHRRLGVVLTCIVDDEGGNSLVESKRGKLFRDAILEDTAESEDNQDPDVFTVDESHEIDIICND